MRRKLGVSKDCLHGHSLGLSFMKDCRGWEEGAGITQGPFERAFYRFVFYERL